MKTAALMVTCGILLNTGTSLAHEQECRCPTVPPPRDSAREQRFDIRVGMGAPMLLSLSISGRLFEQPLTLDAGLWGFAFVGGEYVRAGWTLGLADYRDGAGRGSTLELTPMVGVLSGRVATGATSTSRFIVPEAVVSFDWTWWFSDTFGLGATATLGGIYSAFYEEEVDVAAFPDARLAIGVSF